MAHKRRDASNAAPLQVSDDFTRIRGVGSVIQRHLRSSGISTFAQLVDLSPEAIAAVIPNLSASKIVKQDWVNQARKLLLSQKSSKTLQKESTTVSSRQHYENFTLEFLLSEKNKIRRLQIVSVQSGDIDTLTKWDPERVIDFLAHHTGTRLRYANPSQPKALTSVLNEQRGEGSTQILMEKQEELLPEALTTPSISSMPIHQKQFTPTIPTAVSSKIRLLEWKTCPAGTNQPVSHLTPDQAFDIHLTIDLCSSGFSANTNLSTTTLLYAKELGKRPRQLITEAQIIQPYADVIEVAVENMNLGRGLYRLEAFLTISPTNLPTLSKPSIATSLPGSLIQIY